MKALPASVLVPVLLGTAAHAALVTDSSSLIGTTTVISFSGVTGAGVTDPVDLGSGVELTGTVGGIYFNWNGWGLNGNGTWNTGRDGYAGINDPGVMRFTFDEPMSAVGALMNYASSFPDCTISVLGSSGQVLESYNLGVSAPISTPGGTNDGAFRGILRDQADIYEYRLSTGYPVVDNLTFTAVPETSAALLAGAGALGAAALRRRKI